ncbi:MAG: hypothetical protein ACTSU5_06420 [Promethearchaeota archaeon]
MGAYTHEELERVFRGTTLASCDAPARKVLESETMGAVARVVPDWADLVQSGMVFDGEETLRTVRHVFRSLWVYYAIRRGEFDGGVGTRHLNALRGTLDEIAAVDEDLFPSLLLYHDIGRPSNREWHARESARLLEERGILDRLNLEPDAEAVLPGVIRHHLLLGTTFTGESSYCGALAAFDDPRLAPAWESPTRTRLFFRVMEAFTTIDIWGYDYSTIYDHYFTHYANIREGLLRGFLAASKAGSSLEGREGREVLFDYLAGLDSRNLKWRVACALRIFQFIDTRPGLTREFFYGKLDESLEGAGSDWQQFSALLGDGHPLVQYKYALPVTMVLATGGFSREPIGPEGEVSPRLFQFWRACASARERCLKSARGPGRVDSRARRPWYFTFRLPRGWFLDRNYLEVVTGGLLPEKIAGGTCRFDEEGGHYLVDVAIDPPPRTSPEPTFKRTPAD